MVSVAWQIPDPNQPQWFNRFRLRLIDAIGGNRPVSVPDFKDNALPDPTATPYSLIAVTNHTTNVVSMAFSDGVHWFPITNGSHY